MATAPSRILCPQHLAQTAKDNYPRPLGTGEVTGDEYIQLFWNQRKYIKTIKLDPRNIGVDRIPSTTPGAEPPRGTRDSGSARSHSTHLETSSQKRP